MALYRIKVEKKTVYNCKGKIVNEETTQSYNDVVSGDMKDVANVMLKRQNDFVKENSVINTTFTAKDNFNDVLEIGACTTKIYNKVFVVNTVITLVQISERIA